MWPTSRAKCLSYPQQQQQQEKCDIYVWAFLEQPNYILYFCDKKRLIFFLTAEGQRKAHFEECDAEKKRNVEKLRQLKKEVKEIRKKLAKPPLVST